MRFEISMALAHRRGAVRQASPGDKAGATCSINLVETLGTRTCRRQGGQRKMCPVLMEITTGGQSRQVTTGFTASRGILGGGLG